MTYNPAIKWHTFITTHKLVLYGLLLHVSENIWEMRTIEKYKSEFRELI